MKWPWTGHLRRFFYLLILLNPLHGWAQDHNHAQLKDVSFISTWDNRELYYVEMLPEHFVDSQSADVVIGLHGHGADRWQFATDQRPECSAFRTFAQELQMIAISPEYGSKTSWMGPAAEQDLLQIIKQIEAKYNVGRVFLVGGSMGATGALTFASRHPELIDGVVAMNGHANHLEFENFQEAVIESFGGTKMDVPMEYKKRSAEYWPERLSMPIAFTVGMADSIVPPHSVIRLSNILSMLGDVSFLIVDERGGHDTNLGDAMRAMKFMLNQAKRIEHRSGAQRRP